MTREPTEVPAPFKRQLIAQKAKVDKAEAKYNEEMGKLKNLAVRTCRETHTPMQAVAELIDYTKQRVHQWVTEDAHPGSK